MSELVSECSWEVKNVESPAHAVQKRGAVRVGHLSGCQGSAILLMEKLSKVLVKS